MKYYCIAACLFIVLSGCRFAGSEYNEFRFNPALRKVYSYSLLIASTHSSRHFINDTAAGAGPKDFHDTVSLDFSLKNIYDADSFIVCKLTFNNFKRRWPASRIIFKNSGQPDRLMRRDPLAIMDSIGQFIHGHSVQVVISKKGVVKKVDGMDDMMHDISIASHERHIRLFLQDYISVNAVKDLLNRMFSVIPQAAVKQADRWVRNVTLITKAPVKISNLYTLKQRRGDTAFLDTESLVSAEQSEGGTVYMKGKQSGHAVVSYSTGMPSLYETTQETVTNTSHQYDITRKEHFLLKRLP